MFFLAGVGRIIVLALSAIIGAFASVSPTIAQKYPHQVVKIIVPTAAGGAVDAFGRAIGRKLEESLGITAVVENKAGANGIIGAETVAKSPPDGSTLLGARATRSSESDCASCVHCRAILRRISRCLGLSVRPAPHLTLRASSCLGLSAPGPP